MHSLQLEGSIQAKALRAFYEDVPPPTDSVEAHQWINHPILTEGEESAFRLSLLNNEKVSLKNHLAQQELAELIVQKANQASFDGESQNPTNSKVLIEIAKLIDQCEPTLIRCNKQLCWAVEIPAPHESTELDGETDEKLIGMFSRPAIHHLFITDPDANALVSTFVFKNATLLGGLLEPYMREHQQNLFNVLKQQFESVARRKDEKMHVIETRLNVPIKHHFFNCCLKKHNSSR